jgi:uncharacterized glyoxalase superfamily protein PhnB
MKAPPTGWPRLTACLYYNDPRTAIDWLCRAFDFKVRMIVDAPDGSLAHSELEFGDALLMVGASSQTSGRPDRPHCQSPATLDGANTCNLCLHVDSTDEHCSRARAAGARITYEPTTTDYGADYWADRNYEAVDLEGHHWWFMERVR